MKRIKQRIAESQDFYNGVTVGIFLGAMGVMYLVTKGTIGTGITVKVDEAAKLGFPQN